MVTSRGVGRCVGWSLAVATTSPMGQGRWDDGADWPVVGEHAIRCILAGTAARHRVPP